MRFGDEMVESKVFRARVGFVRSTVPESVTISSCERPLLPNCAVSCWTVDLDDGRAALAASMLEMRPSKRPVAIVRGSPWKFSPACSTHGFSFV